MKYLLRLCRKEKEITPQFLDAVHHKALDYKQKNVYESVYALPNNQSFFIVMNANTHEEVNKNLLSFNDSSKHGSLWDAFNIEVEPLLELATAR